MISSAAAGIPYRVRIRRMSLIGGRALHPGELLSTPRLGVALRVLDNGRGEPADERTADHHELAIRLRAIAAGIIEGLA